MTTAKVNLFDYDRSGLRDLFAQLGEKPFRADQVMKWVYHRHVTDFAAMTDVGKALRDKLSAAIDILPPKIQFEKQASDGTHKWLLGMDGGNAIETVFIPETSRGTLCVSSQVGCGLNCQFCSTATQGFNRNLSTAEIIGQVWVAARHLGNVPHHQRKLTNVVMMGMGEPLANFDAVVTAMRVMLDDHAYGMSRRRVTLSTSGMVPWIDRLRETLPVSLAVSLHAPNDSLRDRIVPINRKWPLRELLAACRRYVDGVPAAEDEDDDAATDMLRNVKWQRAGAPRDFITFEYVMLKNVNDSMAHASELIDVVGDLPCKFNLIPFNPFPNAGFERSDPETVVRFQGRLMEAGFVTTVRKTRGQEIDGACGQLAGQVQDKTRRVEKREGAASPT